MDYSNLSSKLSFREKLSYIQNSDEYKGVLSKFRVVCKLIFSCGSYNLHLTAEKCFAAMRNNAICIFARKIETFTPSPSIQAGSSLAKSHAQEKKKLTQETIIPDVPAGCENAKLKKECEVLKEKNKTLLNKSVVNDPIALQAHQFGDVRRESSGDETKERSENNKNKKEGDQFLVAGKNVKAELHQEPAGDRKKISHLTKYVKAAKDEIARLNKAEQEKKAAKDKAKAKAEIEGNKSDVEKENNSLDTKALLNESDLKTKVFPGKINNILGGMGGDDGTIAKLRIQLEKPEDIKIVASFVKRYNTLGHSMSIAGSVITDEALIDDINKLKKDFLDFRSVFGKEKLVVKNPTIADLSDQYRPSKVSECFSNLYDNAWTDLISELEDDGVEGGEKCICDHVEKCYIFWCNIISDIVNSEDFINMEEYSEENDIMTKNIPYLDKLRSIFTEKRGKTLVLKDIFSVPALELSMHKDEKYIEYSKIFAQELNKVIAFLLLQEPSCVLTFPKEGSKFDRETMREYTRSGEYIDYVVWPVLYLHENGPLLFKGVSQPKSSK